MELQFPFFSLITNGTTVSLAAKSKDKLMFPWQLNTKKLSISSFEK
jgi:hypothetical protein